MAKKTYRDLVKPLSEVQTKYNQIQDGSLQLGEEERRLFEESYRRDYLPKIHLLHKRGILIEGYRESLSASLLILPFACAISAGL